MPAQATLNAFSAPSVASCSNSLSAPIYRRYFLSAIAIVLTAGATWGAYLLWKIAFSQSFTGVGIHEVNAHGHAQIFGWVGLFIMGFAYHAFPRFWQTALVAPRLAGIALAMMVAGIVIRVGGMTYAGGSAAVTAAITGGVMECVAIAIFATQLLLTFRRGARRLAPSDAFIFTALAFFAIQTLFGLWHTHRTMTAPTRDDLLWQVATYQAPLRDLQVHGMALCMILGVSLRILPELFGLPRINPRRAFAAWAVLTAAVLIEIALFITYRHTGSHALAAMLLLPWLGLAAAVMMIALQWTTWRSLPRQIPGGKFIRIAYFWLALSLAMLLLMPVYLAASGIPFSHAYYGAIRHAITVGFISMTILGISITVVPIFRGLHAPPTRTLWLPFLLLNFGCALRVVLQVLTDWHGVFFKLVGISGVLEVTALALWAAHLIRLMRMNNRPVGPAGGQALMRAALPPTGSA